MRKARRKNSDEPIQLDDWSRIRQLGRNWHPPLTSLIKAVISITQSSSAQPTTLHLTLTCNSPATTNPVTFMGHYPPMDLSHSLFLLNSSLDRHLNNDHYGQLELEERANFSRSRRSIERFDEQLQRESAKEQEAKSA